METMYFILATTVGESSGVTNIALFYFFAQVIERMLELIDWIVSFFLPSKGEKGEQAKRGKMIGMWVLASALGFVFAYFFNLDLMSRMGVNISPWLDKIFTAIVIGSGTKPIHDCISLMSRGKRL